MTIKLTARQSIARTAAKNGWTKWEPKRPTLVEKWCIDEYRKGKRYVRVYFSGIDSVISATHRRSSGRSAVVNGRNKAQQIIDLLTPDA